MKCNIKSEILTKLTPVCPFPKIYEETETREGELFSYPRSKICHIRADHDGCRWWNTVWPYHDELATPEMKREIDATYAKLTAKDALCDIPTLTRFCLAHPEACAGASETEYNFYYEGEFFFYWLRLITRKGDYNMYLTAYAKRSSHDTD